MAFVKYANTSSLPASSGTAPARRSMTAAASGTAYPCSRRPRAQTSAIDSMTISSSEWPSALYCSSSIHNVATIWAWVMSQLLLTPCFLSQIRMASSSQKRARRASISSSVSSALTVSWPRFINDGL